MKIKIPLKIKMVTLYQMSERDEILIDVPFCVNDVWLNRVPVHYFAQSAICIKCFSRLKKGFWLLKDTIEIEHWVLVCLFLNIH